MKARLLTSIFVGVCVSIAGFSGVAYWLGRGHILNSILFAVLGLASVGLIVRGILKLRALRLP
jgi:hypothetical protein